MNASSGTSLESSARWLCGAALLVAGTGQVPAQTILSIHDEASRTTRVFTPGDVSFSLSGNGSAIDFDAVGPGVNWYLRFEAPEGQMLAAGRYDHAGCRFPLRMGRSPGMEVTDNNPVCSIGLGTDTLWGSFVIRQIAYDETGNVASLEARFTQRKGSPSAPALAGLIRYEARPLSLSLKSEPSFILGAIAQVNHGDTSMFTLDGTITDGIVYNASVRKDTWRIRITPPPGRTLQAGRYSTRGDAEGGHAGLLVSRGIDQPSRCPDPSGQLDIQKLRVNPAGTIQGLRATFHYRCGGMRPALRGTIRYLE